jgi:hypothetical protein
MTTVGLVMLIAGVVALLARELAVVRLDEVPKRLFRPAELVVIVALLVLAPRMLELLT